MQYRAVLTEQRKQLLIERLAREGRIVAKTMAAELDLSEDTIRRDLRELAAEGLLLRVHGGALPASPTVANLHARRGMAFEEKQRLGRAGAALVEAGQSVFIDGGTTNLELVRNLPLDIAMTVITHSPAIAAALEPHSALEVILIGGMLLRHCMVSVGAGAHEAISRIRVDLCFIGLTGLHPQEGATTGNFEEAAIKRAIITRACETISLVTSEKLGAVSPHVICGSDMITAVVVSGTANTTAWSGTSLRLIPV